jgi:hypothetical protein
MPQGMLTGALLTSRGFWTGAAQCVGSVGRNRRLTSLAIMSGMVTWPLAAPI